MLTVDDNGDLYRGEILVRENFRRTHAIIRTVADLKATLRQGSHTWPGGYPLYLIANDGESLSFESVRENYRQVLYSKRHRLDDGWRVIGCAVNWGENLVDAHSGKNIESAYGDKPKCPQQKNTHTTDSRSTVPKAASTPSVRSGRSKKR